MNDNEKNGIDFEKPIDESKVDGSVNDMLGTDEDYSINLNDIKKTDAQPKVINFDKVMEPKTDNTVETLNKETIELKQPVSLEENNDVFIPTQQDAVNENAPTEDINPDVLITTPPVENEDVLVPVSDNEEPQVVEEDNTSEPDSPNPPTPNKKSKLPLIIGVVAIVGILGFGAFTLVQNISNFPGEHTECVDADNNQLCDVCGLNLTPHTEADCIDANVDLKCDICGADVNPPHTAPTDCVDANSDTKCDVCEGYVAPPHTAPTDCIDENEDLKCDVCSADVEPPHTEADCIDEDKNTECDICGAYVAPEEIEASGSIIKIGNDTITIENSDEVMQEYFIDEAVEDALLELSAGSKVDFAYIIDGTDYVIVSIEASMEVDIPDEEDIEIVEPTPDMEDVFADFKNELEIIAQREPKNEDSKDGGSDSILSPDEKVQTMELKMNVPQSGNIWFRFAWKKNDTTTVVPSVNDVIVELQTPAGSLISQENISKYGRFWLEGNIMNFAIKNARAGDWKFLVTKTESQNLGDISANVLPLTGFISIDKADVNYVGNDLIAIWSIGGVKDSDYSITINAVNAAGSDILVYSGNSLDDGLQLIDTITLSTSKLPAGEYDFVIKVQDWDTKTVSGVKQVTSKSMSHTMTVYGVVIK